MDFKAEGMLYASVMRPPAFGKKLVGFDDSKTRAVNGVVDVVRFGDKIAVLGKNTWATMKGKKALITEWKSEGKLESTEDHDKELFKILDGKDFNKRREDGNVIKAFAEADKILERTYETTFLPHNCLEPMNFYAEVTDEKIHLVGPNQIPMRGVNGVAKILPDDCKHCRACEMVCPTKAIN